MVQSTEAYPHTVTESQNGWVWKGTLEVCLSHFPVQTGLATSWSPGLCPDGFWISKLTSLGHCCPCLVTLIIKKCFLMLRQNILCFSLCLLPLVLPLGTTEKRLAQSSLDYPFRYLCTMMRLSQAFSSPEREHVSFCLVYKHNPCYKHYPKHSVDSYLPHSASIRENCLKRLQDRLFCNRTSIVQVERVCPEVSRQS